MDLTDYPDTAAPIDGRMRPDASKQVAAQKRARHDVEPPTPTRSRQYVPFGVGALVLIALMIGIGYQFSRTPALQLRPTDAPAQAFGAGPKISPTASPAPTSAPTATILTTFTPMPTQAAQSGQGLTIEATATPEPPAAPSYIENVGAQAPHCIRSCDGKPGPNGGDWALVPTISAEQAAIIGAQAPHKVR